MHNKRVKDCYAFVTIRYESLMRAEKLVLWSAYSLQLGVQLVDDLSDLPRIWYICQVVFDYGNYSVSQKKSPPAVF